MSTAENLLMTSSADVVLNALPHPVIVVAADGKVTDANAAAEAFFEVSVSHLRRHLLRDLVPFGSPLLTLVEQVRARGAAVNEYKVDLGTPRNPGDRLVDLYVAPLPEQPDCVVVMLQERTIADKMDRQLTHRSAARSVIALALDSRGRLPDTHRDALIEASARGVEVALVTGRSFHFTTPVVELLPIPLTLIVNNGAVVKRKTGETELRHVLARDAARRILDATGDLEDSVAIVFDRPDERQIVFERMDWSHPNRRGYYEKNQAFITATPAPLRDALSEDPIQVMFNGSVAPMRALVAGLRAMPIAEQFSVAITEYVERDFSLVDVNGAGCSKGTTLARWVNAAGGCPNTSRDWRQPQRRRDARFCRCGLRHGQRDRHAQVARLPADRQQRRRRPRLSHLRVSGNSLARYTRGKETIRVRSHAQGV